MVLTARHNGSPEAVGALEQLCRDYWRPLYAYVRRRGYQALDSEDLVQAFFERMLSRNYLGDLTPGMGRFRTFLLSCLSHFLTNEWDRRQALKRGGSRMIVSIDDTSTDESVELALAEETSPEEVFDRQWALTVLDRVLDRLRSEFRAGEKAVSFKDLEPFLTADQPAGFYALVAARTGLKEGTVKVAVHRMRRRYGELLREELLRTVSDPKEVQDEIRHLLRAATAPV